MLDEENRPSGDSLTHSDLESAPLLVAADPTVTGTPTGIAHAKTPVVFPAQAKKSAWEEIKEIGTIALPTLVLAIFIYGTHQPTKFTVTENNNKLVEAIGNLTLEVRSLKEALRVNNLNP